MKDSSNLRRHVVAASTVKAARFLVFAAAIFFSAAVSRGETTADRLYQTGDWRKAAAAYEGVLTGGASADIMLRAAEANYRCGRLDRAEELIRGVLASGENLDARILQALVSARRGRTSDALRELEALKRSPAEEHKVLTAIGVIKSGRDVDEAIPYFKRAVELDPDDFWAWFNIGLIHEEDEIFDLATKAYKNAVRINPMNAQAQNNLGYSYKERHFYAYAVEHYGKAIELMPDNPGFYYNIGNALSHQEKINDAFRAYQKAVELDPTFAKAHYNIARSYLRKDMVQEAIEEFRLYLKYATPDVLGYVSPRWAVEREIEDLREYLRKNPPERPSLGSMAR